MPPCGGSSHDRHHGNRLSTNSADDLATTETGWRRRYPDVHSLYGNRLTILGGLWCDEAVPFTNAVDDDRLLPADATSRAIARRIYAETAMMPVISPHGHVSAESLASNQPFADPSSLFVTNDHYVTRLLHASGIPLADLGLGESEVDPRSIWRRFCSNWDVFDGTATGGWLSWELRDLFGIEGRLTADNADQTYDDISDQLTRPAMRPRALLSRFDVRILATTDDPLFDLDPHRELAGASTRVVPTFRPDRYLDPESEAWPTDVEALVSAHGQTLDYHGYREALRLSRLAFRGSGATSTDHGVTAPIALRVPEEEARALFDAALTRVATPVDCHVFRAHMLYEMARMSVEDGLVMSIHAGVLRNHHGPTHRRFGPDTGSDVPVPTSFVEGLRPILEDFGVSEGFHLVLFTVDESAWSRELAPLAGFYPSVFIGAPWWFLDAPDAMLRFRSAVTETAGFTKYSGFIDDTRALCSIRARHDVARRVDAAFLARYVMEGRLSEDRAIDIATNTVDELPRRVFKL